MRTLLQPRIDILRGWETTAPVVDRNSWHSALRSFHALRGLSGIHLSAQPASKIRPQAGGVATRSRRCSTEHGGWCRAASHQYQLIHDLSAQCHILSRSSAAIFHRLSQSEAPSIK